VCRGETGSKQGCYSARHRDTTGARRAAFGSGVQMPAPCQVKAVGDNAREAEWEEAA
jgi:hypothetical protein